MNVAIIGRSEWMYDTAIKVLEAGHTIPLIITAKEAPEYKKKSKDFEALAEKLNAKYIYTPRINKKEVIDAIKSMEKIDIALSINYTGVIEDNIIDLFELGILNAHGGDLPKYRGNACQAWAIINGESKIGLCVHKMIGGKLDAGDILSRTYYEVDSNTRIGHINQWMTDQIPGLMLEALEHLEKNPNYILEKQSTDPKDALRCYPRNPDDGKISWGKTNEEIVRLINASSEPYSGAFCEIDGKRLIIWRASIFKDDEVYLAVPGQVAKINRENGEIIVITGNGKIKITDIEIDGIRNVPSFFIKSIRKKLK